LLRRLLEPKATRIERLNSALGVPNTRLVFVCHGNIMRSAFSAQVARAAVPYAADRIVSSGTHANPGREAEPTALAVAASLGVDISNHQASSLAGIGLSDSDLVICMDRGNEARVLQFLGQGQRVFLVGDIDELSAGHWPHGAVVHSGAGRAANETACGAPIDAVAGDDGREVPDPYGKGPDVTRRAFLRLRSRAELWARRHFSESQAQP
jgi:protein-tyrosine phosphatase